MTITPGNRLGPYEIIVSIGAGGMGEVYKARDTRLNRDVAIKVLPESFAQDADRLRRFQLEAQSAGALNHPNILAIHDIGTYQQSQYLVSELLEGETLRDRLQRGKLSESKAVDFARQIAAGLAAAHAKGITHRDIKPENLFVTRDGRVKILDFGLAKVTAAKAPLEDVTHAITSTTPGLVMGTAAYMSPEQARGQAVDQRSDIFSFGCVLYEMPTGERAFSGSTQADVMSAILTKEPEIAGKMSPGLARIVQHCLEKSPDERQQSARDIVFALEAVTQQDSGPQPAVAVRKQNWMIYPLLASLLACGWLAYAHYRPAPEVKFHRLTYRRGRIHAARFAPDSHTIAYSAQWEDQPYQLFTVRDDGPASRALGFSGAGLFGLSSRSELALALNLHSVSAFIDEGTLAQAPFSGGEPRPLLSKVRFADWSPDGSELAVIVETNQGWRIELPAGKLLYKGPSTGFLSVLRFSPDGTRLAFLEHPTTGSDGYVAVVDRGGQKKLLTPWYNGNAVGLAWSANGSEVWFTATKSGSRNELRAVTLNGRERLISGETASLDIQDIARDGRVLVAADLEDRTRIFYRGPSDTREREMSGLDWSIIRDIAPDGKLFTFDESGEGAGGSSDAYIRDVTASAGVKLGPGYYPTLSPGGKSVVAVTPDGSSIVIYPVGLGETKRIPLKGFQIDYAFYHPNGKEFVLFASESGHGSRLYRMGLDGASPRAISQEGVIGNRGCGPSPDAKYIPGFSVSEGTVRLYPLEGGEPREIPGAFPEDRITGWVAGAKAVYIYRQGELPAKLFRLDYETGKREFIREIAPSDRAGVGSSLGILVTPDGKTYAYSPDQILHELYLVEGWK